jgi:hypothetical protein
VLRTARHSRPRILKRSLLMLQIFLEVRDGFL